VAGVLPQNPCLLDILLTNQLMAVKSWTVNSRACQLANSYFFKSRKTELKFYTKPKTKRQP